MRICAVICEYDPFHLGHAYHLQAAREASAADYVLCLMSGPVTQRGSFARYEMHLRAESALRHGADLVLRLPVRYSNANAEGFASGGIRILSALHCVTDLSFGCESAFLPYLLPASAALRQPSASFQDSLHRHLDAGLSYPRAMALALQEETGIANLSEILHHPNAILALEYMKALPDSITARPLARRGEEYHSLDLKTFASASAIRHALQEGDFQAAGFAAEPEAILHAEAEGAVHEPEALSAALLYRLRISSPQELATMEGMGEGLENAFWKAARMTGTRAGLLAAVKSRRYPLSRLSRIATNILLGLTHEACEAMVLPSALHVLGFRRDAARLLRELKQNSTIPLLSRPSLLPQEDPMTALDLLADDLWYLGCKNPALRDSRARFTSPVVLV